MKMLDRVLAWMLLAFGCLHTGVGVRLISHKLTLETAWFFSGGLAIILGALLNLLRVYRPPDRAVARTSVAANLMLLALAVLLAWAVRHELKGKPQAAAFVVLVAVQLLLSVRSWFR